MNVTVENLGPCKRLVRVELDVAAVDAAYDETTRAVQKEAHMPGFRPGKAPAHLVIRAYGSTIDEETRKKLARTSYDGALKEKQLRPVGQLDFEEVQFEKGKPYQIALTMEVEPEFEVPEYKGLKLTRPMMAVPESDVDRALDILRDQRAAYLDVERPAKEGDFLVVNYSSTSEGKPLTEFAPTARGLTEKKGHWFHIQPSEDKFLPGFTEKLVGVAKGEQRNVEIEFPADFIPKELAGRKAVFEVHVLLVKERTLPELNDQFAQWLGAQDVAALRTGVRRDLEQQLNYRIKQGVRDQIVAQLLAKAEFDVPESVLEGHTRKVVFDLVAENQRRGVAREIIEKEKEAIYTHAKQAARNKVRAAFILGRIGTRENIRAQNEELAHQVTAMAQQQEVKPEKLFRQMQEDGRLTQLVEEITNIKVLDFIELNAKIEETLPTPPAEGESQG